MNRTSELLFIVGIVLLVLPMFAVSPLQVVTLHSGGFENGLIDYTIYETEGEVCSTQSGVVYAGSYSAMFTTNANATAERAYIAKYVGATYETLSAEMKFRIDTPLTMVNDHIDVLAFVGGTGSGGVVTITLTPAGMQWSLKSPLGETDFYGTVSSGTWYTIMLTGNYAVEGEIALYVDGTKVLNQQANLSSTVGVYTVRLGITYHWQMSPALTVYADELIIGTEVVQQTLTIQSSVGGSTVPVAGQYSYADGTQASITAAADVGYAFDSWLLDGSNVGLSNPYLLMMNANHTIEPVFTLIPPTEYDLLIHSQPTLSLTYIVGFVDPQAVTIETPITLIEGTYDIVMPSTVVDGDDTYTFKQWTDTLSANPQRSIALIHNLELTAEYQLSQSLPGSLEVHAFAGENEVNAVFSIGGSSYETTLDGTTLTLTSGTYEVTATWQGQTATGTVSLASEEVKRLDLQFSVVGPVKMNWALPVQLLGVGMLVAGIIVQKKKTSH